MSSLIQIAQGFVDELKEYEPVKDYFQNAYLAYLQPNNKIVAKIGNKEVEVLPNDKLGNFFYLRYQLESIDFSPSDDPLRSCAQTLTASIPARLFVWMNKGDEYSLWEVILNFLLSWADDNAKILINNTVLNSNQAYLEEKGVSFSRNDVKVFYFDLTFNIDYSYISENCLPEICPTC